MMRAGLALLLAISLSACAATSARTAQNGHPEARPYGAVSSAQDARSSLAAANASAAAGNKLVLAIFGADWCHDSRALAGWLATPRFQSLIERSYVVVYIDAGTPQKGEGRNLDLAARYGVTDITGTPTVLLIEPVTGTLYNRDSAKSWRNAASRSEEEIYEELALMATTESATD